MKVLIVFLGLFVIQASFVSYQGDMTRYMARQAELKFMAEECASGAAALWDQEAYGAGEIRFDYETGREFATDFVDYRIRDMEGVEDIRLNLTFEDDYEIFTAASGAEALDLLKQQEIALVIACCMSWQARATPIQLRKRG